MTSATSSSSPARWRRTGDLQLEVDRDLGQPRIGVRRQVGELERRLVVPGDGRDAAGQVLGRLDLDIADRVREIDAVGRHDGELGAAASRCSLPAGSVASPSLIVIGHCQCRIAALGAEDGRVEFALEQRRRPLARVGRILLQHGAAELAIGHVRVLGQLREDRDR